MGIPALVVEIISESTRSKDFIKKLDLYMSTGVSGYWIINPFNREVSVYLFTDQNISKSATYKNRETAVSFSFPGVEIGLERIFI
jgi:Uma2 family endonuclease